MLNKVIIVGAPIATLEEIKVKLKEQTGFDIDVVETLEQALASTDHFVATVAGQAFTDGLDIPSSGVEFIYEKVNQSELVTLADSLFENNKPDEANALNRKMFLHTRRNIRQLQDYGVQVATVETFPLDYTPLKSILSTHWRTMIEDHRDVEDTHTQPLEPIEEPVQLETQPELVPELNVQTEQQVTEDEPMPEFETPENPAVKETPIVEVSADQLDAIVDAFDPFEEIEKSAESMVDIASGKEEEPKLKIAEEPFVGILPNYPKVNMTVEVSPQLLKESKDTKEESYALHDFAGTIDTFNEQYDLSRIAIERAIKTRRPVDLSPVQEAVMNASIDALTSPEVHNISYVDGANWSPIVKGTAKSAPVMSPVKDPEYGDRRYVGEDAVHILANRMKLGAKINVMLPHTGIFATVKSPSDGELLDTLSLINTQRIEALRASSGILLGASNFYVNRQIVNLFLNNLTDCSLSGWSREKLRVLIDERDIDIIATALKASIYPDGYEYRQICGLANEKGKMCEHITEKLLDLRRMTFIDNSRLSEYQRNFLVRGLQQRTEADIKTYQTEGYIGYKKAYEIDAGIEFVYQSQTIETSIEAGERWITEISEIVDKIVSFGDDEETRSQMINQRIGLTRIREFGHWVSEIRVDGETNVITDRKQIEELLNSLSRNDKIIDRVSETLSEFQRLSKIAIIGVPRVKCPACQKTEPKDLDMSPHLIPQDAVSRFFTVVRQRLS